LGQDQYLDTLATLFHAYEEQHYPIITADLGPVDTVKFLMEENGMTASDLGGLLGDRAEGPKILNGKRDLSKDQIRLLAEHFKVSSGLFF
jgi:HTH-type transcriptional regulator/antitoxin HigA